MFGCFSREKFFVFCVVSLARMTIMCVGLLKYALLVYSRFIFGWQTCCASVKVRYTYNITQIISTDICAKLCVYYTSMCS